MGDARHAGAAGGRRLSDELRFWVPIALSAAMSLLTLGAVYGKLGGRLDLIEYRLGLIERRMDAPH